MSEAKIEPLEREVNFMRAVRTAAKDCGLETGKWTLSGEANDRKLTFTASYVATPQEEGALWGQQLEMAGIAPVRWGPATATEVEDPPIEGYPARRRALVQGVDEPGER